MRDPWADPFAASCSTSWKPEDWRITTSSALLSVSVGSLDQG